METRKNAGPLIAGSTDRPKVLVVEDEIETLRLLKLTLESAGARVLPATSGPEALRLTFEHRPDVALLDIGMPNMDGLMVCERIRDLSDIPIIMVTAFDTSNIVTRAFALGADDYVTKPFDTAELVARVQACLRRVPKLAENVDSVVLGQGELVIDLRRHNVWVNQREVHLTRTEFDLLVYMARNRRQILTHAMLKQAVWGDEVVEGYESLKQFIGALRRKIEPDPHNPRWLVNEHGVGYILTLD